MKKVKYDPEKLTEIKVKLVNEECGRRRIEPDIIPEDKEFKTIGYGYQVMGIEGGYTILLTARQDGETHVIVLHTSVDGNTEIVAQGLTSYGTEGDFINKAFQKKEEEFLTCRQRVISHFEKR